MRVGLLDLGGCWFATRAVLLGAPQWCGWWDDAVAEAECPCRRCVYGVLKLTCMNCSFEETNRKRTQRVRNRCWTIRTCVQLAYVWNWWAKTCAQFKLRCHVHVHAETNCGVYHLTNGNFSCGPSVISIAPNGGKFLYTENIAKEEINVAMVLFVC
jgi:hypothetical protein